MECIKCYGHNVVHKNSTDEYGIFFCRSCGTKFTAPEINVNNKKRIWQACFIITFFALIGFYFGIHYNSEIKTFVKNNSTISNFLKMEK